LRGGRAIGQGEAVSRIRLDELNPPQREAVTTVDGPLLVLAGAGSGKTRVITYRIGHLVESGVHPEQILAVSFTNKAANEMKERVQALSGKRVARLATLSTFHALGLEILKAEKRALGMPNGFVIYDQSDQLGLVRELLRRIVRDDERRFDAKAILFRISRAKNAFISPSQYAVRAKIHDEYDLVAADLFPKYEEALRNFHAFDFDDLITETVRLFDRDPEALARWQQRFRYVMVDEYQDTNRSQFLLLEKLVAPHLNVCVVGDDDQSIYGWRGAEATHILEFDKQFPGAKLVRLEENYRSTPHILAAANAVIAHNEKRHPKTLWTQKRPGEKLRLVVADDAESEARFVAEEIELLCATHKYKLSDFAVLYRSNIQARPIEEALRAQRINYKVIGGTSFFDRKEVKDAIAYLKLALAPRDEISLRRVINHPPRGIGATTLERLAAHAAKHKLSLWDSCRLSKKRDLFDAAAGAPAEFAAPVVEGPEVEGLDERARAAIGAFVDIIERGSSLLGGDGGGPLRERARKFLEETKLEDELRGASGSALATERRLKNLEGLLDSIHRFEEREGRDLAGFLHRLTLDTKDDDEEEGEHEAVTLVTLHGAKGLEYPVVFLVGMEEELLPHKRTLYPQGPDAPTGEIDLGEERRLMYVGITRARELLYLTRARSRSQRASARPRTPSRFLDEIPTELCEERIANTPPPISPEEEDAFARSTLADLLAKLGD
jgi:DNA helicase-2/ATP-dependent DNA helicase PcrA